MLNGKKPQSCLIILNQSKPEFWPPLSHILINFYMWHSWCYIEDFFKQNRNVVTFLCFVGLKIFIQHLNAKNLTTIGPTDVTLNGLLLVQNVGQDLDKSCSECCVPMAAATEVGIEQELELSDRRGSEGGRRSLVGTGSL